MYYESPFLINEVAHPDINLYFDYIPEIYSQINTQLYIDGLDWKEHQTIMVGQKVTLPRLIAMYGSEYTYTGIYHPKRDLPDILDTLRLDLQKLHQRKYNSVLCNFYRDGQDAVGWHSDNDYPNDGQDWIASISLGATRRFRVRHKETGYTHHWDVNHGDMIVMRDGCQKIWQHTITKTKKDVGPRVNLTYRYISN